MGAGFDGCRRDWFAEIPQRAEFGIVTPGGCARAPTAFGTMLLNSPTRPDRLHFQKNPVHCVRSLPVMLHLARHTLAPWLLLVAACGQFAAGIALAQDVPVPLDPQQIDLSGVKDRTDLSFEESPAYYAILDHVRQVAPAELQQQATAAMQDRWEQSPRFSRWPLEEFPLFYDLTQRPDDYRGQPITLRGHLVRLVKYAAGPNEFGIETLYEGWLVTPDAETHPTTVICTEIPPNMPIGEELIDGVSVTGYFFKLHNYSARDRKVRFAPMVLAAELNWSPVAEANTGRPLMYSAIIIGLLVLSCIAGGLAVMVSRRNRHAKLTRQRASAADPSPDFLNDLTP